MRRFLLGKIKKFFGNLVVLCLLLGIFIIPVSAEEQTEDTSTVETDPEVLAQDAKRVEDVKKIYSKYAKEIGAMKEAALQKAGVTSVKDLSGQSQRAISQAEEKMEEN